MKLHYDLNKEIEAIKNNTRKRIPISGVWIKPLEDVSKRFTPFEKSPISLPISNSMSFNPENRRKAIVKALK